jgi:hypothetical protein
MEPLATRLSGDGLARRAAFVILNHRATKKRKNWLSMVSYWFWYDVPVQRAAPQAVF